jgi:hypothetical protein
LRERVEWHCTQQLYLETAGRFGLHPGLRSNVATCTCIQQAVRGFEPRPIATRCKRSLRLVPDPLSQDDGVEEYSALRVCDSLYGAEFSTTPIGTHPGKI